MDFPVPLGVHIVVRPIEVSKKTTGGIYLPEKNAEDWTRLTSFGKVLAISEVAYDREIHRTPWYQVGDYVMWSKHRGLRMRVKNRNGEPILLNYLEYQDIIGLVPDLTVIDNGSYQILDV